MSASKTAWYMFFPCYFLPEAHFQSSIFHMHRQDIRLLEVEKLPGNPKKERICRLPTIHFSKNVLLLLNFKGVYK